MPERTCVLNIESIFILLLCTQFKYQYKIVFFGGGGGGGGGFLCYRFSFCCPSVMAGFDSLV